MEFKNKSRPNILFKNEPKLSEHEVDNKFNERRVTLVPLVKDFISSHPEFRDKEVGVTFAHRGVSSLVCIVETPERKFILKIRLSMASNALGEGHFLRVWEKAGVKVPHVFEDGTIGGHAYTLMEYIDAPILRDAYKNKELIEKGIYFEMGAVLSKMHEPEGEGYGHVVDGRAEFSSFKDWIEGPDMQKRYQYVHDNMLLGEEHGSLATAIQILTEHANSENKSSYCHDDFGTSNIFATHPITVFDPNPRFNNRYLDLGRAVYMRISQNGVFPQELVDGYFNGKPFDERVLHASILLSAYFKFPYAQKTKNLKVIKNAQDYFLKTAHLLN